MSFRYNSKSGSSSSRLTSDILSRKHRPDYVLIIIALLLCVIGLIVVYAISPGLAATKKVDTNYFVIKQSIAIMLGIAAFIVFSMLPLRQIPSMRNSLIVLSAIGAVLVQAFGEEINGAYRWIQIGGLSFQIAELIKFALIIWLASFLVERLRKGEVGNDKKTLQPLLIVLALIGLVVLILESDTGSSAVMLMITGLMAFTAGLPIKKIAIILGIISVGMLLVISTSSYRRERIATFLNPTSDCQDSGYQSCQALIAVGSGGIFGLGLGKSVQAYGYLPEAANDSIFAVVAEKFGFIGVATVIGLYVALFARLKRIIERTADLFAKLFVVGVLAWLSTQAIINIGGMVGLLPLKGITLPFVSYGGTSILFVMAALGVIFQISRYTSFEPIRNARISEEPARSGQRRAVYGNRT